MRTQTIDFPDRQTICVFPDERSELTQALSGLELEGKYPVIVLIGGGIDKREAEATQRAIVTISEIAENTNAAIVCGGTDMGIMAKIGQIRSKNSYKFPLVGVVPEELVAWPGGPRSTKFLWWGIKRWQLEPHYSHFILVPGSQFGDESAWIVDTATTLSKGNHSVTVLINGGEISRKDIDLSLEHGRPVIALSRTGRLADEFARLPSQHELITVVPANNEQRIIEAVQAALSVGEKSVRSQSLVNTA